jgi:hypothetical protein
VGEFKKAASGAKQSPRAEKNGASITDKHAFSG